MTARDSLVRATLQDDRTIDTLPYGNEPVDLLEIKFKGVNVKAGEKVKGGDEWLKDVSLKLKNRSSKRIMYVDVAFDFPETKATGAVISYSLRLGNRIGAPAPVRTPLAFESGESLNVPLAEEYEKLKPFVEKSYPIASLSRVRIRVNFVGFADGTAWSAGSFVKPDPNNAGRYVSMDSQ